MRLPLNDFRLLLTALLCLASFSPSRAADTDEPVKEIVRYTITPKPGVDVTVTQAVITGADASTAEQLATALNGGEAVPLNEVIVVNGANGDARAGVFALNAAAEAAIGADPAPGDSEVVATDQIKRTRVPYFLAQLRVWKQGLKATARNLITPSFQTVALIRAAVAGGITYYGLVHTFNIPHELAMRSTLLSAGVAYGAAAGISFLKLWYNSLLPWEGLPQPKSKTHLALAALYKGIIFITAYSYLSQLAVELVKPGSVPASVPQWGELIGISTVYVLSQLFWGLKFLTDQKERNLSDANLNAKMGVLGILSTAVVKYMAIDGPYWGAGYAALIGTGATALFFGKKIKNGIRRLFFGAPEPATCSDAVTN